jgi:hypothetical protein
MATTVVVACSSKEEEEVGTNPCEWEISQGERGAGIGNGVLARRIVPDLNQLFVILLDDSENCVDCLRSLLAGDWSILPLLRGVFAAYAAQRLQAKTI